MAKVIIPLFLVLCGKAFLVETLVCYDCVGEVCLEQDRTVNCSDLHEPLKRTDDDKFACFAVTAWLRDPELYGPYIPLEVERMANDAGGVMWSGCTVYGRYTSKYSIDHCLKIDKLENNYCYMCKEDLCNRRRPSKGSRDLALEFPIMTLLVLIILGLKQLTETYSFKS